MVDFYIGTMGFSYKDWVDVFYPAEMEPRSFLYYYSRVFNVVEIDSTFYGTPKPDYVRRWSALTPDGFKFCVKVPHMITHKMGLVGTAGLMQEFIDTMRLLDDKLGVILIQFPPSFTTRQSLILQAFLAELPLDVRFAVEVRDQSWYTAGSQTQEMLEEYGVCWASTQYPGLPQQINLTAGFVYIRWIGKHGSYQRHHRERMDRSGELQIWWDMIQEVKEHVDAIYGFTNNDYAGFAPGTANRFKKIAGLPLKPLKPPQQPKLF